MNIDHTSNLAATKTWNAKPVGSQRSCAQEGTLDFFRDIRAYRYGYETPFIPKIFQFETLRGKKVLEIGVGLGIDAVEMVKHGAVYSGIDITDKHIDLTNKNFCINFVKCSPNLYKGDLLNTNILDNFDLIYSFGVMHHIAHEREYLLKIRSLLRTDGQLMIAVYSKYSFFNLYLILTWIFKNKCRNTLKAWQSHVAELSALDSPVTIKIRSKKQILGLLNEAGFKVIKYYKRGFVQNYIPYFGKYLKPNGIVLSALGTMLGWYHCFICKKTK